MKKPALRNAFYAQSGGVSAVINASACGVIETALRSKHIGRVYAGRDGIVGALTENLIDVGRESRATIRALKHTPAGAFGSARFKLKGLEQNRSEYERLIEVFRAHDIGYFFYNGGNDSMDTALKVSQIGSALGFPVICVGVPKTVDNDLPHTDCCPGFGSVAKYVAVSTREAALDVASMARTSTRVFVLEVMGRHAGWIAAAAGLAGRGPAEPPHLILLPEVPFEQQRFLARVKECVEAYGYCVIVVSEGAAYADGKFLAEAGTREFTAVAPAGLAWDDAAAAGRETGLAAWDAADEATTARAAAILAGQAPRVSFVYLGAVDFAGHATGSGAVYRTALRAADQRVRRLVAAVRSRPSGAEEDWTIVVVTDHGHLDEGGHGGREPEVATAWAAAAGPGIRPGAPPPITRHEDVAPLVLAAAGVPAG